MRRPRSRPPLRLAVLGLPLALGAAAVARPRRLSLRATPGRPTEDRCGFLPRRRRRAPGPPERAISGVRAQRPAHRGADPRRGQPRGRRHRSPSHLPPPPAPRCRWSSSSTEPARTPPRSARSLRPRGGRRRRRGVRLPRLGRQHLGPGPERRSAPRRCAGPGGLLPPTASTRTASSPRGSAPARVFTHWVGCVRSETFRAVAVTAGTDVRFDTSCCSGTLSAILIHGTADTSITYAQGLSARNRLLTTDGCSSTPVPVDGNCDDYPGCHRRAGGRVVRPSRRPRDSALGRRRGVELLPALPLRR